MKKLLKKYPLQLFFLSIIIVLCITFIYLSYYNSTHQINKNIKDFNLFNIDNLLIISHPTDETLWNSSNLLKDNYLVVCISCGSNKEETSEFTKVMNYTKDSYIMLGYPEYEKNTRLNWNSNYDKLTNQLEEIINIKRWNIILTHNPYGEYGNSHHKLISNLVTELTPNKDILYYFQEYHSKSSISNYYNTLLKLDDISLNNKYKLISLYNSHNYIETSYSHIIPYEEIIPYRKWGEVDEKNN